MILDVINRCSHLVISESGWPGKRASDLCVVMQNSGSGRIEQALNKEVCRRLVDSGRRCQSSGDFVHSRIWRCEGRDKVEWMTDSIRQGELCQIVSLENKIAV